jgi:hypothetical protein
MPCEEREYMSTNDPHVPPPCAYTSEARVTTLGIDDIFVPSNLRAIDEETVTRIVESIQEIGLQAQGLVTIEWNPPGDKHRATLVAGRHRLKAFRRLGWAMIPAVVFDGSAAEAELWRIAENLHRKELTALERAEALRRWVELRKEKGAQVGQVSGGRGRRGGISFVADELGVNRGRAAIPSSPAYQVDGKRDREASRRSRRTTAAQAGASGYPIRTGSAGARG